MFRHRLMLYDVSTIKMFSLNYVSVGSRVTMGDSWYSIWHTISMIGAKAWSLSKYTTTVLLPFAACLLLSASNAGNSPISSGSIFSFFRYSWYSAYS